MDFQDFGNAFPRFWKCIYKILEMHFQDFGNGYLIFGNAFSIFGNGFSIW
jgi:hypothetical protein